MWPEVFPVFSQHFSCPKDAIDRLESGSGEVGLARLANDLVGANLHFQSRDLVATGRRSRCCHGIGGVVNLGSRNPTVQAPKKSRTEVDAIRDQSGDPSWWVECTKENVVMTVELLRAGIAKMSQGSRTGFERFMERLSVCVGVSQADAYAQFLAFLMNAMLPLRSGAKVSRTGSASVMDRMCSRCSGFGSSMHWGS